MSYCEDQSYFAQRRDQENFLGTVAATRRVAAIHFELAYRYSLLCDSPDNSVEFEIRRAAN